MKEIIASIKPRKQLVCAIVLLILLTGGIKISAQPLSDSCMPASFEIHFKNSIVLINTEKRKLDSVIQILKSYPSCKVLIEGYGYADEEAQQISWDKVESVVKYLRKKDIDKKNFVLKYGSEGNPEIVRLSGTTEDGPNWIPAPIPCYSLHLPRSKRCINADGTLRH